MQGLLCPQSENFPKNINRKVFAPWSLLKFLGYPGNGFENYWFESGGKTRALVEYFKSHSLKSLLAFGSEKSIPLTDLRLSSGVETLSDLALLAQAGYLTIKKVIDGDTAFLGYPNKEVSQSMAKLYTDMFLKGKTLAQVGAGNIVGKMAIEPAENIVQIFSRIFESIDYLNYPVENEAAVRALVQTYLAGAGLDPKVEVHGSMGRSDLEVRAGERLFVFEFKAKRKGEDGEALLRQALGQIKAKRYGEQHETGELVRLAMVFSIEERRFVKWAECPVE